MVSPLPRSPIPKPIWSEPNQLFPKLFDDWGPTHKMFRATGLISGTLSAPSRTTRFDHYLATCWAGTISWTITTTARQKPLVMTAIPPRIFRVKTRLAKCHLLYTTRILGKKNYPQKCIIFYSTIYATKLRQ